MIGPEKTEKLVKELSRFLEKIGAKVVYVGRDYAALTITIADW